MSPGQRVELPRGGQGVLFLPDSSTSRPVVIVLHERYGLVKHTLDLATRLANDGYVSFAPDLFSHWSGEHATLERGDVRVTLADHQVAQEIADGVEFLRKHPRVQPDCIVLMGVCQSGRYPIVVASQRNDIAACVIFYGAAQLSDWHVTENQPRDMGEMLGTLQAPALFVFGEGDHVISLDDVLRTRGALEAGRRSYRMRVFPDVPHGWLNDTMPGRYRPESAKEAWSVLLTYLVDVLENGWPGTRCVRWEFESSIAPTYDFSKNRRFE